QSSAPMRVASVGLGAETGGKNWKLNSNPLLATQGGTFTDRSGLRVGGQYGLGALQFTGDYSRTGVDLDPKKDAKGGPQSQRSTALGIAYRPSDRFRFATSYKSLANTGQKGEEGKTLTSHELALKPTGRTSLLAARVTEEMTAAGKTKTLQTDTLALEVKPTDRSTFIARRVTEERDSGNKDEKAVTVQTDTLRLEQKLVGSTSAIAELQSVSNGKTETDTARLGLSTKVIPGVALETTAYQKQTDPGGDKEKRTETGLQAKLVSSPGPLQVQTRLEQKQVEKEGQSTASLDIATKGGTVKLQGELGRNTSEAADKSRLKARLEVNPVKPLKFSAGLSQSAETKKSDEESEAIRGAEQQFGVELKPNDALSLSAHLQTTTAAGETNITSVTTQLKPFSFLQVSGTLHQRDAPSDGIADADTRIAQLSLHPIKGWKLMGGYLQNPEENGKIQQAIRRRLGMETSIGSLMLNGGYEFEDRMGDVGARTTEVGFGLAFSSSTQLRAMYKLVDGFGEGTGDTSVYGLKFNRNLGDTFHLSLEGEATQKRDDLSTERDRQYKGAAKLGVKF
ncbi:MAG: hypothetical protein KY468_00635, partial [Armatimonadetes bacterium]|nr:hypothetical protein [Armatimonadota bacterium]